MSHIENGILSGANLFIRVDIVLAAKAIAGQYNAKLLS
jgi:hypothetical protein